MSVVLRSRTDALEVLEVTMSSWSRGSVDELMRDCAALYEEASVTDSNEISNNVMRLAMRVVELSTLGSALARAAEDLLQLAADELLVPKWPADVARQTADGARLLRVAFGARDEALAVCALRHLRAVFPESTRTQM